MKLEDINYDNKETGCCARFDPVPWEGREIVWDNAPFVKDHVRKIFHFPINFGQVMVRIDNKVREAETYPSELIILSDEKSLWGADVYFAVDREVPNAEMAQISGTFITKPFEGPFTNIGKWIKEMEGYVKSQGKEVKKLYFYYTTCPKCAKVFGKNYVVIFAQV